MSNVGILQFGVLLEEVVLLLQPFAKTPTHFYLGPEPFDFGALELCDLFVGLGLKPLCFVGDLVEDAPKLAVLRLVLRECRCQIIKQHTQSAGVELELRVVTVAESAVQAVDGRAKVPGHHRSPQHRLVVRLLF